jgi:branched-chain amino acid aminotransferase
MIEPDTRVWWNGKMAAAADVRIGILTHTLHYGVGVFEGIRAYAQADGGSAVFRLDDHIARMLGGARILRIELPFDAAMLTRACIETLRANQMREAYLRPIVFLGQGRMGIHAPGNPVNVAVTAWKWGAYLGEEALRSGVRAKVSSFTRTGVNTCMVRAKVPGQYVTSVLAKSEVAGLGYDEAILLDKDGYCAEGSGENLFLVRRGVLVTPPLSSPILDGITRDTVLTLAGELGIDVCFERFTRDELYVADEAFFTGTAAEITPIRSVDDRPIGAGKPGPVTRKLQDAFRAVVRGEGPRHAEWRTPYGVG